jgi:SAM-dependent methyltransferase
MPVHEVAQRGFDAGADAYERARPSYPADAVAWLVEHCEIRPGATVCDLAAGTGKLTRLLVGTGASLLAVEPVEGMSRHLRDALAVVPVAAGTAEALPFTGGSLDAVTVAQAFHWFDADRAFAELARVLRPGGRLGIIWNARDRSVDVIDALWSIMDRVEKKAPWRDHEHWRESALGDRPGFGELHSAEFRHEQMLDRDAVVERFASVSHVAVLPETERAAVLDEVRDVLEAHPGAAGRDELAIPYRVDAYWCERLP